MAPTFYPDEPNVGYFFNLEQGSPEWLDFRKNFVTGTSAYKLLQGESIQDILAEKANEKEFSGNKYTARGHELEDEARQMYSELYNRKVIEVGAVINTRFPQYLCSPDGLVLGNGERGGIEIKAFQEERQEEVFQNLDPKILSQIRFCMFVTKSLWWDWILYNPDVNDITKAFRVKRFYPDREIFQKFEQAANNSTDTSQIEETALQIIDLEAQLRQVPEEIKAQFLDYQTKKAQIQELKDWLKSHSSGKVKKVYEDDFGNKLDISIYDTNRVSVADETLVPEEYTTTIQVENVFQGENGKFYQRVPNSKLAGNIYKAGKSLPPGFKISTSRSISIKFNGETL